MYVQQFTVDGLGCASYLIGCEVHGVAAVIDPDRDTRRYLDAVAARGARISHIIETHLHADHISGNTDLAARTGATICVHEAGRAEFPHAPMRDGDILELGTARLQVRHTPGHTPDSVTVLAADLRRSGEPWLAFTGDTLFVGDVGRPDLVGLDAARELAGHLYDSLFGRLLALPDSVLVYPGHGKGSLCGRSIGAMPTTTLGFERRFNPALRPRPKPGFVQFATDRLPEQPANHAWIKQANRRGPTPLGEVTPRAIPIGEALARLDQGAVLLDVRPRVEYVRAHIPGSVHLQADPQLSNRSGFVLPADAPVILLLDDHAAYSRVVLALARVGFEQVLGCLNGGLNAWQAMGLPLASGGVHDLSAEALRAMLGAGGGSAPVVLDVREPWEFEQGHVPGARLFPLGQLLERVRELDPARPTAVICETGNRSQSAAALLVHRGFAAVYNVSGGTAAWVRSGFPVE